MSLNRPDLSAVDPAIIAYIESLEAALEAAQEEERAHVSAQSDLEPSEPPTTRNVITLSRGGRIKRTPRHHYSRQRRGGMGVFDLDVGEEDAPAFLAVADESEAVVLLTNQGRAFRLTVASLPEAPVRARGESLTERLPLRPGEETALLISPGSGSHLVIVTQRGQVRRFAAHLLGGNLQSGTMLMDPKEGGAAAAYCWSSGAADLFIACQSGRGIRFSERQVPVRGCLGVRLELDDRVVGVASVEDETGVFMVTPDGKGTVRIMAGFSANKSPGSGGKTALRADRIVAAMAVAPGEDVLLISRLSKIVRFAADEIPPKEGVVQGVNCMSLRADEVVAATVTDSPRVAG